MAPLAELSVKRATHISCWGNLCIRLIYVDFVDMLFEFKPPWWVIVSLATAVGISMSFAPRTKATSGMAFGLNGLIPVTLNTLMMLAAVIDSAQVLPNTRRKLEWPSDMHVVKVSPIAGMTCFFTQDCLFYIATLLNSVLMWKSWPSKLSSWGWTGPILGKKCSINGGYSRIRTIYSHNWSPYRYRFILYVDTISSKGRTQTADDNERRPERPRCPSCSDHH